VYSPPPAPHTCPQSGNQTHTRADRLCVCVRMWRTLPGRRRGRSRGGCSLGCVCVCVCVVLDNHEEDVNTHRHPPTHLHTHTHTPFPVQACSPSTFFHFSLAGQVSITPTKTHGTLGSSHFVRNSCHVCVCVCVCVCAWVYRSKPLYQRISSPSSPSFPSSTYPPLTPHTHTPHLYTRSREPHTVIRAFLHLCAYVCECVYSFVWCIQHI
jgi:hypothetical protein